MLNLISVIRLIRTITWGRSWLMMLICILADVFYPILGGMVWTEAMGLRRNFWLRFVPKWADQSISLTLKLLFFRGWTRWLRRRRLTNGAQRTCNSTEIATRKRAFWYLRNVIPDIETFEREPSNIWEKQRRFLRTTNEKLKLKLIADTEWWACKPHQGLLWGWDLNPWTSSFFQQELSVQPHLLLRRLR